MQLQTSLNEDVQRLRLSVFNYYLVRNITCTFRWAANLGGGGHCGQRQNTGCELICTDAYFYLFIKTVLSAIFTNSHILQTETKHRPATCILYIILKELYFSHLDLKHKTWAAHIFWFLLNNLPLM